jgi:N-acetylglucosamine-6-phosphate deacetylase
VSALRIEGHILTPKGFVRGAIEHEKGRITCIEGTPRTEDQARAEAQALVLPGFIDTHVHGGGGSDTMEGGEAIRVIARLHARHGTTVAAGHDDDGPLAEVEAAMRALAPACASRASAAARVLGVHLEGPYINPASSARNPISSAPLRSRKSAHCTRWRQSG